MWQTKNKNPENQIVPLVAGPEAPVQRPFFEQRFPYDKEMMECFASKETRRTKSGDFLVAVKLKRLLAPHAQIINEPDITNIRLFYFPFKAIKAENSEELNNLCLARVIVLLQFLTNPDLTMNRNKLPRPDMMIMLENSFNNGHFGLNALRLLFSYGLSYEKFLIDLQLVMKKLLRHKQASAHLEMLSDTQALSEFLCESSAPVEAVKEQIVSDSGIFRPVLALTKDDLSLRVYEDLRQAYRAYQKGEYLRASTRYENAYLLLSNLKEEENQPELIAQDYEKRAQQCQRYMQICENLHHTPPPPSLFTTLYGFLWPTAEPRIEPEQEEQQDLLTRKKMN